MSSANTTVSGFPDTKNHYIILDGLRGVAALVVVMFHIFEASASSHFTQIINHGYLAVDFFYVLSGFVVGYAYDDRWGKMTLGGFFKRRLIRLHPMVVMGMIIGAVTFYMQGGATLFPMISQVPVWKMLLIFIIGCTLIPVPVSMDIRGWQEMHPLNGPGWSLFFEYIANILYALFIRRFSKIALAILVFIAGGALVHMLLTNTSGDVAGGWSLDPVQFRIGVTRFVCPFFAGLLLSRMGKLAKIKNAFLICSLLVIAILAVPRIGGPDSLWMNALYESFAIIFLFPLVVYLGASGIVEGKTALKLNKFLGDISYPIYITHYPLIYIYTAWVVDNKIPLQQAWPYGLLVFFSSIVIAYACLKLYDEPVRKWLLKKFKG